MIKSATGFPRIHAVGSSIVSVADILAVEVLSWCLSKDLSGRIQKK